MKIAFVKFAGLSSGGTERWLQYMAHGLAEFGFEVDFYYCDSAPYLGSAYIHPDTDSTRKSYLENSKVNLIKFEVGNKNVNSSTHDWIDTNFWELFDETKYDFVQTGKAGPAEYPFNLMSIPVVELVALDAGVDNSKNIAWTILVSQNQRARWVQAGGSSVRSSVIPVPVFTPTSKSNLRDALGIPNEHIVAGFHQAPRDEIFSEFPLDAFAKVYEPNRHFIIMSGSNLYRKQAEKLDLKNVHFVDFSSDENQLSRFLNSLDFFAHGRRDGETFGTVFAEAMIHGKSCLSHISPKGSNGHIETIGPAGFVERDFEHYVNRMEKFFQDSHLRDTLGTIAKIHASTYYSYESALTNLVFIYENLFGMQLNVTMAPQLDYAYSHLGYLQSGPLNDPSSIANHILVGGTPEEYDLNIALFFSKRVSTFVDIGANIGLYCLKAFSDQPNLQVHAFEPQPSAIEALQFTKKLNKWNHNFQIHELALSNSDGRIAFHLAGTGSTLNPEFLGSESRDSTMEVSSKRLDSLSHEINFQNSFLKIDVEGHELSVLQGADSIIKINRPTLFIEIAKTIEARNYINDNYRNTLSYIQERKYKIFVSNGRNQIRRFSKSEHLDGVFMYLCLPSETWRRTIINLHFHLLFSVISRIKLKAIRKISFDAGRFWRSVNRRMTSLVDRLRY